MPIWFFLFITFSTVSFASPEYSDWLSRERLNTDSSLAIEFISIIGDQQQNLDVIPGSGAAKPVDAEPEIAELAIVETVDAEPAIAEPKIAKPEIESSIENSLLFFNRRSAWSPGLNPDDYKPPVLNQDFTPLSLSYYGLDLTINFPVSLEQFWRTNDIETALVTDSLIRDTGILASQLSTIRQHYNWSDWELLRFIEHLNLVSGFPTSTAILQWQLMQSLGYDVRLAKQQDAWFLLYSAKQPLNSYPSIKLNRIQYYFYATKNLEADQTVSVHYFDKKLPGKRLNLILHKNAYYGSEWSELQLTHETGNINLPISIDRAYAVINSPVLPIQFTFNRHLTERQENVLRDNISIKIQSLARSERINWLVKFVEDNFSDQPAIPADVLAIAIGMTPQKNMSYVRSYMLRQLLRVFNLGPVVVVENSSGLQIAIQDLEFENPIILVNSKGYRILSGSVSESKVEPEQKEADSDSFISDKYTVIILN